MIQILLLLTFIFELNDFLMSNIRAIKKQDVINNQRIKPLNKMVNNSFGLIKNNPVFKIQAYNHYETIKCDI